MGSTPAPRCFRGGDSACTWDRGPLSLEAWGKVPRPWVPFLAEAGRVPGAAPVAHTGCCPGTPWEDLGPSQALSTHTAQQVTGHLQQLPMVTMLQGSGE